jgi:hypothetical protein
VGQGHARTDRSHDAVQMIDFAGCVVALARGAGAFEFATGRAKAHGVTFCRDPTSAGPAIAERPLP